MCWWRSAVSVNRTFDIYLREGTYAHQPELPHILGVDPSGVITAVGENVTDRKVGDRVFCSLFQPTDRPDPYMVIPGLGPVDFLGVTIWGGYAQYVRSKAARTVPIPDNLGLSRRHGDRPTSRDGREPGRECARDESGRLGAGDGGDRRSGPPVSRSPNGPVPR